MTIIDAIIQGVVQGLTEFLPVSSSGHLAITQHITGVAGESNLFFNVMLHVGTLVAVAAFYHKLFWSLIKEFFRMLRDIFTGKFKWREMNYERNLIVMLIIALLPLFIMFLPVPGTDMKVKDLADIFSGAQILLVTALSLLLTSILLAVGARCNKKNSTASFKHMKGSSAETKRSAKCAASTSRRRSTLPSSSAPRPFWRRRCWRARTPSRRAFRWNPLLSSSASSWRQWWAICLFCCSSGSSKPTR